MWFTSSSAPTTRKTLWILSNWFFWTHTKWRQKNTVWQTSGWAVRCWCGSSCRLCCKWYFICTHPALYCFHFMRVCPSLFFSLSRRELEWNGIQNNQRTACYPVALPFDCTPRAREILLHALRAPPPRFKLPLIPRPCKLSSSLICVKILQISLRLN